MATFNLSRIGSASTLIGFARGCLEHAVNYARNRRVGDSGVSNFQGIQWLLAEMVAELEAARSIRDRAALAVITAGLILGKKTRKKTTTTPRATFIWVVVM